MNTLQRTARVIVAVTAEAGAVAALILAGRRPELAVPLAHVGPWLHSRPPADVLVAVLRWVALAGAVWLLASTVLYVAAAASRVPSAVRAVGWSTLPIVRRAVDAAFAVTVVTGAVLAPAAARAATDPPAVSLVRDGRGAGGIAELPPDTTVPPTTVLPSPPLVPAAPPASAPASLATEVVIAPGDNLWELAARQVAAGAARARAEVTDDQIAPYWVRVCDANRAHLLSGDPNLVYPGERVVLPPVG